MFPLLTGGQADEGEEEPFKVNPLSFKSVQLRALLTLFGVFGTMLTDEADDVELAELPLIARGSKLTAVGATVGAMLKFAFPTRCRIPDWNRDEIDERNSFELMFQLPFSQPLILSIRAEIDKPRFNETYSSSFQTSARTGYTFELGSVDVAQIPLTITGQLDAFDEVVEALVEVDRVQSIECRF